MATGRRRPALSVIGGRLQHRVEHAEALALHADPARLDRPDLAPVAAQLGRGRPFAGIAGLGPGAEGIGMDGQLGGRVACSVAARRGSAAREQRRQESRRNDKAVTHVHSSSSPAVSAQVWLVAQEERFAFAEEFRRDAVAQVDFRMAFCRQPLASAQRRPRR